MRYLYGFTDAAAPPDRPGLDDQPVRLLRGPAAASAAVSDIDAPPDPEPELLWRHEAVVEALLGDGAVLPARFGTVVDGDAAVEALLARHRGTLDAQLERVRGHVELGLRIREPAPASDGTAAAASSGRDYLLRRRAEVHAPRLAAAHVHESLCARASEAVTRPGRSRREVLVAAYLVPTDAVDGFVDAVRALERTVPDLALVLTGPWPAYHFSPRLEEVRHG